MMVGCTTTAAAAAEGTRRCDDGQRMGAILRHLAAGGGATTATAAGAAASMPPSASSDDADDDGSAGLFSAPSSGLKIGYRDVGPRTAPVILFIAGVGARMDTFDRLIADLSSAWRCITLDNRGVGASEKPTLAYTIDDMALDTLELFTWAAGGEGHAHVVGQSMGGMIAQRMAVLQPHRIRSLVLCSTVSWCDGRTSAYWGSLPTLAQKLQPEEFTRSLLPWMFGRETLADPSHPAMLATLQQPAEKGGVRPQPTPPHTWQLQIAAMLEFDSRPWLSQVTQPTLVTVGTDDIGTAPYQSEHLAEHIAHARLHHFEGAGHRALNEHHDSFLGVLTQFLLSEQSAGAPDTGGGPSVGFVGLGNMGGALVRSMLRSGTDTIVVFDQQVAAFERLLSELEPAQRHRLKWAQSPREVAAQCTVTCSMVPGPPEMRAVALSENGIVAGLLPGSIYIEHTTTSPSLIEEVNEAVGARGASFVDAPVMGDRASILNGVLSACHLPLPIPF